MEKRALRSVDKAPTRHYLLDIMMPGMDGYEVCRRLKAAPHTRNIPVIFLSALNDAKDQTKGFEVGAVGDVTKPFEAAEVKACVQDHLEHMRFRDQKPTSHQP